MVQKVLKCESAFVLEGQKGIAWRSSCEQAHSTYTVRKKYTFSRRSTTALRAYQRWMAAIETVE
eukprot:3111410-Amphidinium_carterae.2